MRTTFYAVTDRRALVFEADSIASVDRRDIVRVLVRLRHAGRRRAAGASAGDVALHVRPQGGGTVFVGLRDAPGVAALLRYDGGRGTC
jgi:hypothetical protein